MEASLKKLLDRKEELRRQRLAIDAEDRSIDTALEIIDAGGIEFPVPWDPDNETEYFTHKPFKGTPLTQACLKVLRDHRESLDKTQVEYFVTIGGYEFKAQDPTSSVEVTLRRLANDGKCSVDKQAGPHGSSKYKLTEEFPDAVEDSRTTK